MKTLQHAVPTLGADLIGEHDKENGLALFRGIPYANVTQRWTHSKTQDELKSPFDATKFGPRCSQGQGQVLVSGGVNDPIPGDDEFGCLNLNITVPNDVLPTSRKQLLPVMVWIHGGAFHYGANSVARYRPTKLCSMAKAAGTPIILVSIGYRLGPFGFAASNDLISEIPSTNGYATTKSKTAKVGSYGFVDQRNAFQWIRSHIGDFGGDPDNVTAFGVSAGSASVHFHILTGEPLFDRAIMMSGAASTLGPLPFHFYEDAWVSICKRLDLQDTDAETRLARLRALSPEEIIKNYSKAAMGPWGDGTLLPSSWKFADANKTRCKAIILGDTRVEAIILDGLFKNTPQNVFHDLVRSILSPTEADEFSRAFGFSPAGKNSDEEYIQCMRHFFSVMMFQYPNIGVAEHSEQHFETYLYHFEEPSPYPGPTYGVPYHGQCALYMHNNEIDQYPASGKRVAQEMATAWTAFAHGEQPWEPYRNNQRFMRFGPGSSSSLQTIDDDNSRNYKYIHWLKSHWSSAEKIAQRVLQGES